MVFVECAAYEKSEYLPKPRVLVRRLARTLNGAAAPGHSYQGVELAFFDGADLAQFLWAMQQVGLRASLDPGR